MMKEQILGEIYKRGMDYLNDISRLQKEYGDKCCDVLERRCMYNTLAYLEILVTSSESDDEATDLIARETAKAYFMAKECEPNAFQLIRSNVCIEICMDCDIDYSKYLVYNKDHYKYNGGKTT